ncbi:hypothetical protein A7K99_14555 [Tatumella citrea]|uniref:Uncharacterized protein n=1 Tax=Tatumella citrea TaxID=53336 RepID=A0A1Y0LLU5_TATCI|nr:hypothetical protein A7K98_14570 [Tatumella citrea]ARU98907.1 hypothetical protein A7K99_14555 [Tatumella citrea]
MHTRRLNSSLLRCNGDSWLLSFLPLPADSNTAFKITVMSPFFFAGRYQQQCVFQDRHFVGFFMSVSF